MQTLMKTVNKAVMCNIIPACAMCPQTKGAPASCPQGPMGCHFVLLGPVSSLTLIAGRLQLGLDLQLTWMSTGSAAGVASKFKDQAMSKVDHVPCVAGPKAGNRSGFWRLFGRQWHTWWSILTCRCACCCRVQANPNPASGCCGAQQHPVCIPPSAAHDLTPSQHMTAAEGPLHCCRWWSGLQRALEPAASAADAADASMAPAVTVSALHEKLDAAAFDSFFEHCILRKFFPASVPPASPWLHAAASPTAPSSGQSVNVSLRRYELGLAWQ